MLCLLGGLKQAGTQLFFIVSLFDLLYVRLALNPMSRSKNFGAKRALCIDLVSAAMFLQVFASARNIERYAFYGN